MSMKNYFKAVVLFAGMIFAPVLALAQSPCTITQLPYACRLDTMPECWNGAGLEYSATDTFLYLSNQVTLPRFADNLPLYDLTVRMKVKPTTSLALSSYLLVGFKDSVGGAFVPIDTLYPTTTEFKQYEIPLLYQENARILCLRTPSMVSFYIKDFIIEQTPSYPCPSQAYLVDVDATSATVSWVPRQNENSWLYSRPSKSPSCPKFCVGRRNDGAKEVFDSRHNIAV